MQNNRRRGFACVLASALALGAASFGTTRTFAKTLAAPRSITVADGPAILNAGDFNEDGIQDLAIAINRTSEIGIVFGKRNGKLRRIERYAFTGLVHSANGTEWTQVVAGGSTSLTLKGGASLEALFPAGFPISIRVVNPDGWQIRTTFTRSASAIF